MKQQMINIILLILIGVNSYLYISSHLNKNDKSPSYTKLEQPEFLNEPLSDSILLKALVYYEIKEPLIVLAQSKLESANYKSRLFKEKNNFLGLYNSEVGQYYNFEHWSNYIIAYKNTIEYRHKDGEDYYRFLLRIKYAEDVHKVKSIVKKLPP